MKWIVLMTTLLATSASAQEVTSDNCAQLWQAYFSPQTTTTEPTGSLFFRAAGALESIGKKKATPVTVASCSAGPQNTSTTELWNGQFWTDGNGNRMVMGNCTTVDVVEVQGRRGDKCRRFPTSRICTHRDDTGEINILVGSSSVVPCE